MIAITSDGDDMWKYWIKGDEPLRCSRDGCSNGHGGQSCQRGGRQPTLSWLSWISWFSLLSWSSYIKHIQANGLVIIQQGERKCLEQIRWEFTFSLSWFETTDNTIAIISSRKAADDMEDPIAIMLKYLNVMGNISTKNNKTLVVPIPKVYYSHTCHVKL